MMKPKYSMVGIVVHRIRLSFLASKAEIYLTMMFYSWAYNDTDFTYARPVLVSGLR